MVSLIRIHHFYVLNKKKHPIFHRLSMQFSQRGNVLITGDSGVGKSTLLHILYGSMHPRKGRVDYGQVQKSNIRYFSQEFHLTPGFKVKDYISIFGVSKQWLEAMGLETLSTSMSVMYLSGGEAVRFYLMLLLIQKPEIILLDEPTHALDHTNVDKVIDILKQASGLKIIATHDQRLQAIANQTLALEDPLTYTITNTNTPPQDEQKSIVGKMNLSLLSKKTKQILFKGSFIESVYQLARLQLQAMMIMFPTLLLTFHVYQSNLDTSTLPFHVSFLTESIKEEIPDSPFRVIKYQQPTIEKAFQLVQGFNGVSVYKDYSQILPKIIEVNDVIYEVRMSYLPFYSEDFSIFIIGPTLQFDQLQLMIKINVEEANQGIMNVISFAQNLHLVGIQKTRSPLEKPIIYFSAIQIKLFAEKFPIQHSQFSSLAEYVEHLPSDYLVLGIENKETFFHIQKALQNDMKYTLINQGVLDQQSQASWFFVLNQSVWFLLWLTLLVYIFFTSMVFMHDREKASQIFTAFIRLGVSQAFFKTMMHRHYLQTSLLETSMWILPIYGLYQLLLKEFLQSFSYFVFVIFIVSLYQTIHIMLMTFHTSRKTI
jgi:ABC-type lipoprotein export system ATPase subunit